MLTSAFMVIIASLVADLINYLLADSPLKIVRKWARHALCNTSCWPFRNLRKYVIWSVSGLLSATTGADPLTALLQSQKVHGLVYFSQYPLLTLSWFCCNLREYAICLFFSKIWCWSSHGLVATSECTWSHLLSAIPAVDPPVALLQPHMVCDLACFSQHPLLTFSCPCCDLSWYMIWSVFYSTCCWSPRAIVTTSVCTWSGLFSPPLAADPLATLLWPQKVRKLLRFPHHLRWLSSSLVMISEYVI